MKTTDISSNSISILELKQALMDSRFHNLFPEYSKEIKQFLVNPVCKCNKELYDKLLTHKDRLAKYFPTKDLKEKLVDSSSVWKVISCHKDELESELNKLKFLTCQFSLARFEDQVTIVIKYI